MVAQIGGGRNWARRHDAADLLDHLTSNMMRPLGGIAPALVAGWTLPMQLFADEIGVGLRAARLLQFLLRYIVLACVAVLALFPLSA